MHILVADDDCGELVAQAVAQSLASLGLDVRTDVALSLDALTAMLGLLTPDALVLDLRFHGCAPERVIPLVRTLYQGRIIVASGDDRAPAFAALHGCECLPKPYDPWTLARVLKGASP